MNRLIFIFLIPFYFTLSGQSLDSITVETVQDTLVRVKEFYSYSDGRQIINVSQPVDSSVAVRVAFNRVARRSGEISLGAIEYIKRFEFQTAFSISNQVLIDLTGANYFAKSREEFIEELTGYYRLSDGNANFIMRLTANGQLIQVDPQGTPVPDGLTGNVRVTNLQWITIRNIFPENVDFFDIGDRRFVDVNSANIFRFIRDL